MKYGLSESNDLSNAKKSACDEGIDDRERAACPLTINEPELFGAAAGNFVHRFQFFLQNLYVHNRIVLV